MFEVSSIIQTYGSIGVGLIVFFESSVFPILPGDSLLFTAGFLAEQNILNIYVVSLLTFGGAVLGNILAYGIGRKYGNSVFSKPESFLLNPDYIEKTRLFFEKHGAKALIIARFVPIVRTFLPLFAGIGKMPYRTFLTYNIVGAFIWVGSLVGGGYYMSKLIPGTEKYIHAIVGIILVVSMLPGVFTFIKKKKSA